jgi:hypothetical protein
VRIAAIVLLAFAIPQAPLLTGVVTDAGSGEPVFGARVLLARVDGPLTMSVVLKTDERGQFSVSTVSAGTYRVFADEPGYVRREHSAPVVVAPGKPLAPISIALTRRAVVTGVVRNEHGEPISGVVVRAWSGTTAAAETRTDDLGEYRLFGLAPGSYVVGAERYAGPRIEGTFYIGPTPPCPDCPGEGAFRQALSALLSTGGYIGPRALEARPYPVVYFPATTDRRAAAPIEVGAGAVVGGIDLRLVRR